jgi:Beta-lactamase
MRDRVFKPLGMDATEADSATESVPNRVTPYFPRYAADPRYGPDPMRDLDYSCYAGASVFLSTPSDLVRFHERGLVVAVVSNTSYADTPAIALKIAEAFANRMRPPAPKVTRRTP